MSPGSSTESYSAFANIGLRENPGKNLNQVTCPDRESKPEDLVFWPAALTVTPQYNQTPVVEGGYKRCFRFSAVNLKVYPGKLFSIILNLCSSLKVRVQFHNHTEYRLLWHSKNEGEIKYNLSIYKSILCSLRQMLLLRVRHLDPNGVLYTPRLILHLMYCGLCPVMSSFTYIYSYSSNNHELLALPAKHQLPLMAAEHRFKFVRYTSAIGVSSYILQTL
ncbi:hypothetical protein ANN_13283 [Periplaneta americana]|uniref:Uncharacterized protein n=1 Tax=Periplaneta americana TaxID=6978 RepID=A0ABQ8TKD3_PERAM|nr:hypothetical protein ANN_13283 [Periplaneta americana]